jgi:hypothetical protein
MNYQKLSEYLSIPRMDRYFLASNCQKKKAISLYKANLKIAQSLYPLISVFEFILRNKINSELSIYFQDPNWILNQRNQFMSDSSLIQIKKNGRFFTNDFLKSSIEKSEKRLKRLNLTITSSRIIADQSFGFWTEFFEVHHYKLLKGRPIKIFDNLPTGMGRKEVSDRLNKIRMIRNRISHNEPICFKGTLLDFTEIEGAYLILLELISWINPDLNNWMKDLNQVTLAITQAKSL